MIWRSFLGAAAAIGLVDSVQAGHVALAWWIAVFVLAAGAAEGLIRILVARLRGPGKGPGRPA